MDEGTTEHFFVPQVQTLLHCTLGWLLFSSYVPVFCSESLERKDIPCTSGYKTSCPSLIWWKPTVYHWYQWDLPSRWSCVTNPRDTIKASFWRKNIHQFLFWLKTEFVRHDGFVNSMKVHSTCGLSSRLTLAGGGGGGEDEGGVLVTTCSGPPCGFTVWCREQEATNALQSVEWILG